MTLLVTGLVFLCFKLIVGDQKPIYKRNKLIILKIRNHEKN